MSDLAGDDQEWEADEALWSSGSGEIPATAKLLANYPNPLNPSTVIRFDLARDAHTTLTIFNVIGQRVAVLVDGQMDAGSYQISWDASGLPSGVYYYQLRAGGFVQTNKMTLMK